MAAFKVLNPGTLEMEGKKIPLSSQFPCLQCVVMKSNLIQAA